MTVPAEMSCGFRQQLLPAQWEPSTEECQKEAWGGGGGAGLAPKEPGRAEKGRDKEAFPPPSSAGRLASLASDILTTHLCFMMPVIPMASGVTSWG